MYSCDLSALQKKTVLFINVLSLNRFMFQTLVDFVDFAPLHLPTNKLKRLYSFLNQIVS